MALHRSPCKAGTARAGQYAPEGRCFFGGGGYRAATTSAHRDSAHPPSHFAASRQVTNLEMTMAARLDPRRWGLRGPFVFPPARPCLAMALHPSGALVAGLTSARVSSVSRTCRVVVRIKDPGSLGDGFYPYPWVRYRTYVHTACTYVRTYTQGISLQKPQLPKGATSSNTTRP